jgi:hypothetical protein
MTIKKKFDKSLYDIADKAAKEAMVGWLKEHDHSNISTNETTYFDIVCTVDGDLPRLLYEVEIKYSWRGEWPESWDEIRIPERKRRLLDKWQEECPEDILTFVVFRDDCLKAWHIDGHTLLDCEVREASNRNIQKGEKFFHIPTNDAYLMDMSYESSD